MLSRFRRWLIEVFTVPEQPVPDESAKIPPLPKPPCPECQDIFDIYRRYVIHEDDLVNQRTTWMTGIQSFLLAALALSYHERLKLLNGDQRSYATALSFFMLLMVVVAVSTSGVARRAVSAAHIAVNELADHWDRAQVCCRHVLPDVVGGGSPDAVRYGSGFAANLPRTFQRLWVGIGAFLILDLLWH